MPGSEAASQPAEGRTAQGSRKNLGNPGRLCEFLAQHSLAAVVASAPENIVYCTGHYSGSLALFNRERPYYVVWPAQAPPTLIAPDTGLPLQSSIKDTRRYARLDREPAHLLADVILEKGLVKERLGLEMADLSAGAYRVLIGRLPQAQFADGTSLLDTLRMVKTAEEIEMLGRAARAAETAIQEAFAEARAGDTEKAIADQMVATISRKGAEIVPPIALAAGPRSWGINPLPSPDHEVGRGDLLRVDLKGTFSGYQADVARTAVMGQASLRQRNLYASIVEIEEEVIEAVRPGIRAMDLYEVVARGYRRAKLSMIWGTFGHGIGLRIHEAPFIGPTDATVLEPGMVLCIEPGYVEVGGEGYNVEDLVLVTTDGHRVLTERRGMGVLPEIG